jgi:peptidoglycan/LPS O-acetylase OafA/YrhL
MVLAMLAVMPVVLFAVAGEGLYAMPYLWLIRLLGAFVAGSLACLVVRRIPRTARTDRMGTWWSYILIIGVVAVLYIAHALDRPNAVILVVFLFPPLLVALAIADGGPARLLSTRPFVTGGHFSYSVYLVHMLIIEAIWWAQSEWPSVFGGGQIAFHVLLPLIPVIVCVAGYLMWRFVEEPARKKMRRMVDTPLTPVTVSPPPVEPPQDPAGETAGDRVPEKV